MAWIYPGGLTDTDFSDGETNSGYQIASFIYGAAITISSTGTVTALSSKMRTTGGTITVKYGLYDSSGTLIGQTTASVTSNTQSWVDSAAVSFSISSTGTYYVMVSGENNDDPVLGFDTSGNGSYATETYATAMASSETISSDDTGKLYGVRLDLTAGGSQSNAPRMALLGAG